MIKIAKTFAAAAVVLALALVLTADPFGQSQTSAAKPSAMDYRRDAMNTFDQLFDDMTKLMASTSMEPTKTTKVWEDLVNDRCNLWSLTVDQAEMVYRDKSQELPSGWTDWRKDIEEFIAGEIQTAGKDVMTWRWKAYRDMFSLERDIEFHPVRKDEWLKAITDAEKILVTAEAVANDGSATVEMVDQSRANVKEAESLVENVAIDLKHVRERVIENHGAELKMDPKIAAIQTRWIGLEGQYPSVINKWKTSVAGWAKNIKTTYESQEKLRKQFDTIYEPVMKQDLFSSLKHFKGLEYKDMETAVTKVDQALQSRWMKAKDKSKKDEEIAKALEDEKILAEKEKKRYWELNDLCGPAREAEEKLKWSRATDDASIVRDLEVKAGRMKNNPEEQKAADAALKDYRDGKTPKQIAGQKAWEDYQKLKRAAEDEMTKIVKDRAARLKKLGLPPDPDWPSRY
jgi:hypothetical protein